MAKQIPATKIKPRPIKGGVLRPSAGVADRYHQAIESLVKAMCKDVQRSITAIFEHPDYALDERIAGEEGLPVVEYAMDESAAHRSKVELNAKRAKWQRKFREVAKSATDKMIDQTLTNSARDLDVSLKAMSSAVSLKTDVLNTRLQELVRASTTESANLIRLIPEKYLGDVQNAVMRSITSGNGMKDLQPFFERQYGQNVRHAKLVALDQTRKVYAQINAGRMQALGVRRFEWVHSGGSPDPRPEHVAMNGKTYSLVDPPVIGVMYGAEVRGIPGQLPNCRCTLRPIVEFDDDGNLME